MRKRDYALLILGVSGFIFYICINLYALGKLDLAIKKEVYKHYNVPLDEK